MRPVLRHHRPLTSMETLQPASQMVKVEHGLIRCMSSKVSQTILQDSRWPSNIHAKQFRNKDATISLQSQFICFPLILTFAFIVVILCF